MDRRNQGGKLPLAVVALPAATTTRNQKLAVGVGVSDHKCWSWSRSDQRQIWVLGQAFHTRNISRPFKGADALEVG